MKTITSTKKQSFRGLLLIAIAAVLSSCGSYQYSGYYEEDGIYGASQREDVAYQDDDYSEQSGKNNYYQQYFSTKSAEIDALSKEGDIFTDIDNYTTTDSLDADGYIVYVEEDDESYGAWGTNGQDVTVNIYESAGFGWAQPFWWNGGFNYGWGWNNWGWGYGFNPAWNYWAWNPNFGWGFGYGWGYGYGWGVPGYGFYNNGFCWYRPAYNNYYLNGVAYNRGRRVTGRSAAGVAANSRINTRGSSRSNYNSRRSTYSRSELARRLNNTNARRANNYSGRRNSSMNSNRSRNMNSNNRRSNRSIFNSRSSRRNNNFNSRSTRSSGSRMSSPRSSGSRSSGMRSGGGSRGGGMSRGGGGRGGRGGRG